MAILERLKEMQTSTGKNRIVMVLDGMGIAVMDKLLDKNGFLYSHLTDKETALIPATTVAATTAYRTGKMPWETGFIGWAQYFSEIDEVVEMFTSNNYYTNEPSKLPFHSNTLPCNTVVEQMNQDGKSAFEIMPWFVPGGYNTFDEWLDKIVEICNSELNAYIYAYWPEPDGTLHETGSKDLAIKNLLREMEHKIETVFQKIHNKTDVLITADHGHKDAENIFLDDYPEVAQCLALPTSLESRCVSCFVKPEYLKTFPTIFDKYFGKWFKLVTKQEFETDYLHAEKPVRFVGDFVALATDKYSLLENHNSGHPNLKSRHAGITPEELEIPIIKISIQ